MTAEVQAGNVTWPTECGVVASSLEERLDEESVSSLGPSTISVKCWRGTRVSHGVLLVDIPMVSAWESERWSGSADVVRQDWPAFADAENWTRGVDSAGLAGARHCVFSGSYFV